MDPLERSSDILPPSFYTSPSAEPTIQQGQQGQQPEQVQQDVTIGRSAESVSRDPANLTGALMLPLLSYNDYQEFLKFGLDWFKEPSTNVDSSAFKALRESSDQINQVMSDMLNQWNESIAKISEMKKMLEKSPLYLMVQEQVKAVRTGEAEAVSAQMSTLVITASFAKVNGELDGILPMKQAWSAFAPFVQSDMRAELGLVAAFYASQAMHQVALFGPALQNIAKQGGVNESNKLAAAKGYAFTIAREVLSPSFNTFVEQVVLAKVAGAGTLTPTERQYMSTKVKLVLLMSALALSYKVETGAVTAREVAGMLTGEMDLAPGDYREVLISLIKVHVASLPEGERQKIVATMLEYLDSDPDVEELLEPSEVFRGILGTSTLVPVQDQPI